MTAREIGEELDITAALLVENPAEMVIAAKIRTLRAVRAGAGGYLATRLNDQGLRTRRWTEWRFQYVAAILKQGSSLS
jgi:hypothetical protein